MRVLITGSRTWTDRALIRGALLRFHIPGVAWKTTLVSGNCPDGADRMSEQEAENLGWDVERHPADWARLGKAAGFVRNAEMVKLGAHYCLAFIRNRSKGATMTADLAIKANIPTLIYRDDT